MEKIRALKNCFSIGSIVIKGNVISAPMAGITDLPFRLRAKQGGASLVYSEMLSAKALEQHHERTKKMLEISGEERPVAVQIFGGSEDTMRNAAMHVQEAGADILDINLGCPVKKVCKSGSGMALLKSEENLIKILRSVIKSVQIPVTVKMRIGLTPDAVIAPHVCSVAEQEGIAAVVIHARPASNMHKGPAYWDAVARAVNKVKIPVIANGGICDGKSAVDIMKYTGCAGVMIGRAAIGDFTIFNRIQHYINTSEQLPSPAPAEKIETFKDHLQDLCSFYGETMGIRRMRKIIPAYFKELPDAASIRNHLMHCTTIDGVKGCITSISVFIVLIKVLDQYFL
ncbi:MAG: tRNA dihydrouridine synthase DusB [bacterium]